VTVNHQAIKFRPLLFDPRDPDVHILTHNVPVIRQNFTRL
jgi:hypothetical protein